MSLIEQIAFVAGSVWLWFFMMGVAVLAIIVAIGALRNPPKDGDK